ncbi:MAG: 3-dehydroquinate synthase [Odoribacteraceae bacterium]|jgi:3-dehydroquinate synthase|nr:3-dehydroquinate synthase [Odoribacteraceae bacterium]
MQEITLHGSRILVGECAGELLRHLPDRRPIVITNPLVSSLYQGLFPTADVIKIGDGEAYKTLDTIDYIAGRLIEIGADRDSFILGIGGGVVCDVAGFAASIYMRGCPFGFVPTTLLAQVDASVGGKNGVNRGGFKNMLGAFNQPRVVLCDPLFLQTLPAGHYAAGFAEIVKAAMIADGALFEYLRENIDRARARDGKFLERVIRDSILIKARVVAEDERERGNRRLLNLGHTFAHAIEKRAALPHGQAVSVGVCIASRLSLHLGLMTGAEVQRVIELLALLGLPTTTDIPLRDLLAFARADKKKSGDALHLILPVGIGACEARLLSFAQLEELVDKLTE